MAITAYGVNNALAVKLWAKKLFHEVTGEGFFKAVVGEGSDSLVQLRTETSKGAGDRVRVGLRMLLNGAGVQGDSTLEGQEEALTTYTDDLLIDQLRHAARSSGKMSEQRVPFSVREECKQGLADWWKERLETALANQLTGYTGQTDTRYTGNNATIAPSSGRLVVGGGQTGEASLSATTTHAIRLADLDRCVAIAKVQSPRIRPISVDGKQMYVAFLHPYQIYQLRRDASTAGNFFDIQKAMLQGGKISNNPIVTGAEFIYNNVIVREWSYLPTTVNATGNDLYRRGVFCGAQSALLAVGQGNSSAKMEWVEEKFDYGNQLGVSAGMIVGIKKTVFNSTDFSTIVLSGYAPAP